MSDVATDADTNAGLEATETTEAVQPASSYAELRRAAREGDQARSEIPRLQRQVAMLQAGVPLHTKLGRMFFDHYDVEADVEAVKAAWAEIAPPEPEPTPEWMVPEPEFTADEIASTSMRQMLANGSPASDFVPTRDPRESALLIGEGVRACGGSTEEAMAAQFDALARAALEGDPRVRLDRR